MIEDMGERVLTHLSNAEHLRTLFLSYLKNKKIAFDFLCFTINKKVNQKNVSKRSVHILLSLQ